MLALSVRKTKAAMNAGWRWELPPKVAKPAEGGQAKKFDTFVEVGHLWQPNGVIK
jgi:hypothetical protein